VNYAFIIITPDDVGSLKGEPLKERGRQNVIFEWGVFLGKIGRSNTCLLIKGDGEIPSDLHGVGFYRFNESVKECFLDIDNELKGAKIV
jgi:predicted nucleotide-binding protein